MNTTFWKEDVKGRNPLGDLSIYGGDNIKMDLRGLF
jgi:hypothetical protein